MMLRLLFLCSCVQAWNMFGHKQGRKMQIIADKGCEACNAEVGQLKQELAALRKQSGIAVPAPQRMSTQEVLAKFTREGW